MPPMPKELKEFLGTVKIWCEEERGRQRRLAEHLGGQRVTGEQLAGAAQGSRTRSYFRMRAFIEKEKNS